MTTAETEIQSVVRMLKIIGWPLTCLFGGIAVLSVGSIVVGAGLQLSKDPAGLPKYLLAGVLALAFLFALTWCVHGYIRLARRMEARDPDVAKAASQSLVPLMILGFPLFLVIGLIVQH